MSGRRDFLSMPAPENYVAGLGRGATGFTTRSDLGPAREGPSEDQIKEALAKRAAQLGAAAPTAYGVPEKKEDDKDDDDERFQDPENEVGLFAGGTYDRDDDEADRIYQEVDEKMDRRRKIRRLVSPPLPTPYYAQASRWFIMTNRLPTMTTGKHERKRSAKNTNGIIRRFNNSSRISRERWVLSATTTGQICRRWEI